MPPYVTALYAALNAFINIALAYRITLLRNKYEVSIGTNDVPQLAMAIRQHANNAEYLPLAIVMLLICELCGGASVALHLIGGGLVLARIFHAVGLPMKRRNPLRWLGTALTFAGILGSAGYALYLRLSV